MADLSVIPSLQLKETDILTVDKLNLMATPVVSLSIVTPVTDENFFRNGNFYSSFWTTPAGMSCPLGVETVNANYWSVNPSGAAVTCKRSTDVPDLYSLWSMELDGAANVTDCSVGQQINGDLSATLRRPCTFSCYLENNSGGLLSPTMEIWTANSFNDFDNVTLQTSVNLQTVTVGAWGYETVTLDLSTFGNVANGLFIKLRLPSGALSSASYRINFSRLKIQLGEVATQFVDDPALFLQTPSIDSTMLQDGCIARASLFLPNVIPKGTYQAGSIQNGDIGVGAVEAINLDPGVSTTTAAPFVVPAVNADVNITVTSATGISTNLVLNIQGAGLYETVSVSGTVVIAQNTGAAGNASPGTVVPNGNTVTTTGNAVVGCLGYTPVNKAGDSGVGQLSQTIDTVVGGASASLAGAAILINSTTTNQANDAYMPAIGFNRPNTIGRALGLSTTGQFKTVDNSGGVGYLLDTVTGVATAAIQDGAVTIAKLAQEVINLIIPSGIMAFFSGPSPPAGWFVADGSAVSRTTYSALFAAIGTYWGAGDNVSTFNLPDLRGRAPIGYVNTPAPGITGRGFGSRGGEETHQISIAEMPGHDHGYSQSPHDHGTHQHTLANALGTTIGCQGGGNTVYQPTGVITTGSSAVPASNANISFTGQGGWQPHNTMMPFAVGYWIVKA
jgi:microcystin-dependent protein